jgi:hypothetical protein
MPNHNMRVAFQLEVRSQQPDKLYIATLQSIGENVRISHPLKETLADFHSALLLL